MGADNNRVLLEVKNLRKEFLGVVAVNDVSLDIRKGEVHIIIGENGAGKSTVVKMIAGVYGVDGGEMLFDGKPYRPRNVADAQRAGINMIHQELNLMPNRTVAQNIFIGRELKRGIFVDEKAMNRESRKILDNLEIDIDPSEKVQDLSIAKQQMVELARALAMENRLLIMDEPTSSLTQKEIDELFRITRQLKEKGVAIVYISHRMQELFDIGDRITVMRDGCYVGTRNKSDVDMQQLIQMMVGRKINDIYKRNYNTAGVEILRTERLTGLRFRNVDISVRSGEIVGLAGLVGAGRTELARAIFGYDPIETGKFWIEGAPVPVKRYCTHEAVKMGISLLPEDRKKEGIIVSMSIKENVILASLNDIFKYGFVQGEVVKSQAEQSVRRLRIMTTSIEKAVGELSGGNQQKVVLAKWLVTKSKLFIFDEPTRGIDIGAKSEIYDLMDQLAKEGAAIFMISSDLPELLGISDRIYVMKDGEITGEVHADTPAFEENHILHLALTGSYEQ